MDRQDIKGILPHREPMLLVDSVEIDSEGCAVGRYCVRGDEFFLQGHFPGRPVVPGVILCEMMAQACCVLLKDAAQGKTPLFTKLDKVRFKRQVVPGDVLVSRCSITRVKEPFYFAQGVAQVDGQTAVSAEFGFALSGALTP